MQLQGISYCGFHTFYSNFFVNTEGSILEVSLRDNVSPSVQPQWVGTSDNGWS